MRELTGRPNRRLLRRRSSDAWNSVLPNVDRAAEHQPADSGPPAPALAGDIVPGDVLREAHCSGQGVDVIARQSEIAVHERCPGVGEITSAFPAARLGRVVVTAGISVRRVPFRAERAPVIEQVPHRADWISTRAEDVTDSARAGTDGIRGP